MTAQPDDDTAYIRGAGSVINGRRLLQVIIASGLVILALFVAVLTIEAVDKNARFHRLQQRGVAVDVTVTSCLGLASGTGITVSSFQCRGSFTLNGNAYNEVIGSSGALLAVGSTVHAVADPKNPATLSTARSVVTTHTSWRAFVVPAILFVLLACAVAGIVMRRRMTSRTIA